MPDFLNALQAPVSGANSLPLAEMLLRLLIAFGLGCAAALVHQFTTGRATGKTDRSFLATLVLLAVLIALVTVVIADNVARAFSLAGALAIVRFRTVVADSRDTAFVIYTVVAGMAAGYGFWIGPVVCIPLVFLTAWTLQPSRDGTSPSEGTLILRLAAGRPPDEALEAMLKKHLEMHRLAGLSTARGGSALDASYTIRVPAPEKVFALVAELSRLEGVQGVELKER